MTLKTRTNAVSAAIESGTASKQTNKSIKTSQMGPHLIRSQLKVARNSSVGVKQVVERASKTVVKINRTTKRLSASATRTRSAAPSSNSNAKINNDFG